MLKPAVLLLLLSAVAAAQATGTPIGFVKTVSGQAQVITGPQVQAAVVGTPVHLGRVLRPRAPHAAPEPRGAGHPRLHLRAGEDLGLGRGGF